MLTPRVRLTVRWLMIGIAAAALLMARCTEELHRRWKDCQVASARHEGSARTHLDSAARDERRVGLIDALLKGEDVDPAVVGRELPDELHPDNRNWSPAAALRWRQMFLKQAAVQREKAAMHLGTSRRYRQAFFVPWEACVLGDDLY